MIIDSGKWFLPDNPDTKFDGDIKLNSRGHLELSITGAFSDLATIYNKRPTYNIILGDTMYFHRVTLVRCIDTNYKTDFVSGITKSDYYCEQIYLEKHYNVIDEIKIWVIVAEYFELKEWFQRTGIKQDFIKYPNYKFEYKVLKPLYWQVNNNETIICSNRSLPEESQLTYTLYENITIEIRSKENYDFESLDKKLKHFENLILFFIQQPLTRKNLNLIYSGDKSYTKYFLDEKEASGFIKSICVIKYKEIEKSFPRILKKWFLDFEIFRIMVLPFVDKLRGRKMAMEEELFESIKALEYFNKYIPKSYQNSDKTYKKLITSIERKLTNSEKDFFITRIKGLGHKTLKMKLKEIWLYLNIPELDNILLLDEENIDTFISKAVGIRISQAHRRNQKIEGSELFLLTNKVQILLYCCILIKLGITRNKIRLILPNLAERFHIGKYIEFLKTPNS